MLFTSKVFSIMYDIPSSNFSIVYVYGYILPNKAVNVLLLIKKCLQLVYCKQAKRASITLLSKKDLL